MTGERWGACPWCGTYEVFTEEDDPPAPGQAAICSQCVNIVVEHDLRLRRPNASEMQRMMTTPDVRAAFVQAHGMKVRDMAGRLH